ncbi:parafibromin-like [Artemia franciscana]|uniref:Parafibromin n=1 Tax=Artemia franciscana TaxID=6661 RepID=A0AA88I272_ARTSF|nr:hypothetical protein QYM36_005886 [Artemia franciscana]
MADPLSLLRQYNVNKKEIVERDNQIIFGEFSSPKTVKTNYIVWGSGKDNAPKQYYTLECLLYLLKNIHLQHPTYVRQAAAENIPVVVRPDRKDLLAYLNGETTTSASIDKSAPLEIPIQVKRTAGSILSSLRDDESGETLAKRPRFEDDAVQKVKDQLAAKLDAPKDASVSIDRSLSEALSIEKLAAIKAKVLANKRKTIRIGDDVESSGIRGMLDDVDLTKDILSRERQWRTRTTVLQGPPAKTFSKNIFNILQALKAKEDGRMKPPHPVAPLAGIPTTPRMQSQPASYSRYHQESFRVDKETEGFKIDTMGSYHGMNFKTVTEGSQARRGMMPPRSSNPPKAPQQQQPQKRVSKTPIIVVPSVKSLITMLNAKDILQDLKFISSEDKRAAGAKKESDLLIQRRKESNLTVPYRVTDNPQKLSPAEWDRVVAVFVQGQTWQFKGWPWNGDPTSIFVHVKAFHIKFDDMPLDANVGKWAVTLINLSRNKRHLDRAAMLDFWEALDKHILKNKPSLRF